MKDYLILWDDHCNTHLYEKTSESHSLTDYTKGYPEDAFKSRCICFNNIPYFCTYSNSYIFPRTAVQRVEMNFLSLANEIL